MNKQQQKPAIFKKVVGYKNQYISATDISNFVYCKKTWANKKKFKDSQFADIDKRILINLEKGKKYHAAYQRKTPSAFHLNFSLVICLIFILLVGGLIFFYLF